MENSQNGDCNPLQRSNIFSQNNQALKESNCASIKEKKDHIYAPIYRENCDLLSDTEIFFFYSQYR